jgi:hypothetical protein
VSVQLIVAERSILPPFGRSPTSFQESLPWMVIVFS